MISRGASREFGSILFYGLSPPSSLPPSIRTAAVIILAAAAAISLAAIIPFIPLSLSLGLECHSSCDTSRSQRRNMKKKYLRLHKKPAAAHPSLVQETGCERVSGRFLARSKEQIAISLLLSPSSPLNEYGSSVRSIFVVYVCN